MPPAKSDPFERLLEFLRDERGFDFTGYKRPSLRRRIGRRMSVVGVSEVADYHAYLVDHPEEFVDLFNTILINVTGFFRDAPVWEALRDEILPSLFATRPPDAPMRVWSTGCASGEEPYSLAITLAEAMGAEAFRSRVKIYATDVDEEALTVGRHALYTGKQLSDVPEDLREKYFDRVDSRYAFRNDLRRNVIFGRHDLIQDPPISKIDLLMSRNTLMYLEAETQRRILTSFHFALRDDGLLVLGKSEVLVTRTNLFAPVDLKHRVFTKLPRALVRERMFLGVVGNANGLAGRGGEGEGDATVAAALDAVPVATIVIGEEGALAGANLHARSTFGLGASDLGRPIQDLEISYRPLELRSRIDQVHASGQPLTVRDVAWSPVGSDSRTFDVHLAPLSSTGPGSAIVVSFTDVTHVKVLTHELELSKRDAEATYEELQSMNEELETTNEELQATNEELETTNEELQSTNEELETMNEEMQSTNEELETTNDELRQRTDEVSDVNYFLEAVLANLSSGVAVLDEELRIEIWSRQAEELWGLRSDEVVGQHLMNLDIGLPLDQALKPLRAALAGQDGAPTLVDAVNRRGRAIRCRLRATRLGAGDETRGVILLMEDDTSER